MKEGSLLDRFIGFFSPKARYKRATYKAAAELVRKYEAASVSKRTSGWRAMSSSANAEIETSLSTLRNRSRQLARDNPFMARALQVITNNTVGKGIFTQIKVSNNTARQEQLNKIWKAWADTPAVDYDGVHTYGGLQRLIMRSVVESGEVLVRLRRTKERSVRGPDGDVVEVPPIQLQVLESDFLDSQMIGNDDTEAGKIIQGVEFNADGKRVAYHLFKEHPGQTGLFSVSRETVRIPAEEILHLFRVDRPGQVRGVPWGAPSLLKLRDFDDFEDAQLLRQKIAACYSVFVRDLDVPDAGPMPLDGEVGEKLSPGTIEILPPGKDISFAQPPGVEGYGEYSRTILRGIAAGMGVSFEAMAGDYSQFNFSSGRLSFLEMNRNVQGWRSNILVPQFLNPVFEYFLNGLELLGMDTQSTRAVYTPPRREMIDPLKEVQALKESVRSGFLSQSEAIRNSGQDPQRHYEEMAEDNKKLDELGLVLDTDPRQDSSPGGV